MQGVIIDRPLVHFVGLKVVSTADNIADAVADARRTLLARQFEISGIIDPDQQYGVTLPMEQEDTTDNVTTYIGFAVASIPTPPPNMFNIELAAGKYAQFSWKGPFDTDEFEGFYPSMFAWFQQQQSLVPSTSSPWIEMYGTHNNWDDRSNPNNELTVLVPLGGASAR